MTTIKATLHHYNFPSAKHPGYIAMCAKIRANAEGRGHWMNSYGGDRYDSSKANTSEVVEIETAHVFGNQWNTADGRRVFDWFEEYLNSQDVKRGHWLEITPELAELRRVTLTCGYCGKHYGPHHDAPPATPFCTACLDSPYLKAEDLKLLRLLPVLDKVSGGGRADLNEIEKADLMPRYVERQTVATDSRAKAVRDKQRVDILAKFEKVTKAAEEERDGMLWLWDQGINLDNVIYYDHTQVFSFGWRSPVSAEVKSRLLEILSEFPFQYEIKPASGSTLTNAWKK